MLFQNRADIKPSYHHELDTSVVFYEKWKKSEKFQFLDYFLHIQKSAAFWAAPDDRANWIWSSRDFWHGPFFTDFSTIRNFFDNKNRIEN